MITDYLSKNIRWQFNQNPFCDLLCLSATTDQTYCQMEKLANKYFPEKNSVETLTTEFCLNKIALKQAKTAEQKVVKELFDDMWQNYLRLKNIFRKPFMLFPSSGMTRLEHIAKLIAQCTQFCADNATLQQIAEKCCQIINLNEREERFLFDVIQLYKIKYYCACSIKIFEGNKSAQASFAKAFSPQLLKFRYRENDSYVQNVYAVKNIVSIVDCIGNSATKFDGEITDVSQKIFIYANGRNVFDTFCNCKLGNDVAEFMSSAKTTDTFTRYFLTENCEIRNVAVTNRSKRQLNYVADVTFLQNEEKKSSYFEMDGALCVGKENTNYYVSTMITCNNEIISCSENGNLSYKFTLDKGLTKEFSIITAYAHDTPRLAEIIANAKTFGADKCPYIADSQSINAREGNIKLSLTPNGYEKRNAAPPQANTLSFTYQLGDDSEGTFLDNAGNSTTLLSGFPFKLKGESVYSVKNGVITKLNGGIFRLEADRLLYDKQQGKCLITHSDGGKTYAVAYSAPCKTLFYFPLEEKSQISLRNDVFYISDSERRYSITCYGKIESYTTNALECGENKLRYKLSDDLESGTCLAICFAQADNISLTVKNCAQTFLPCPIVRESLVSTYLNYVNGKNAFCLKNRLKKVDALTLSAICYTNPRFVKAYICDNIKLPNKNYYYDANGRKQQYCDILALPLACVYYQSLIADDLPAESKNYCCGIIFNQDFTDKDLCVKALFLKRAAQLSGYDKVKCLIEYNKLKKQISSDSKLYAYAQAIGALPLISPSKERLKDLCNKYDIPKSWYYVSQLENLYGLSLVDGKLNVCPNVSAENALEQLSLRIDGKRIQTSFCKSSAQSMTLNGIQCFQPFCPKNLKKEENVLEVRY